jgi:DNA-binding HxlR family transcriptional regulator
MPTAPTPKRHPYAQWAPDARALDLVGDKWTLLIVRDLSTGPRRFVELQRVLPGISTEQLRSRLNRMVADGLLTRQRYREVPPRVDYELTARAKELLPVLGALGRWGHDWAWSAPRESEAIDIGAIFRIAPGLIDAPVRTSGTAAFAVQLDDATTKHYTLTIRRGETSIAEAEDADADVHVSGSQEDWIEALGPDADRSGLQIDGDEGLASLLLDSLGVAAESAARAAGVA